ncbi:MAG TPA: prepilin-type N-terminal cleavage/methylation domain-containing protein [Lacunisphaera sp.]|nr:prepilin-type N-terminal cleavage/methylation domain-containing protein [Lacunisphaera sp.]
MPTGFTLLEILVVVGLMAALSAVFAGSLVGGSRVTALESAQGILADVLTFARTRAVATGSRVRVLVNAEPGDPVRFRRMLVVQQEKAPDANAWTDPLLELALPEGVYLLPYRSRIPAGFIADPATWTRSNATGPLDSSALSGAPLALAIDAGGTESWDVVQFTSAGTLSFGMGDLVLGPGKVRAAGSVPRGESPVQLTNPEAVRGVSLSLYGLPVLIDDREGF